ncbi:MAG: IMP dehydrogenase, partial [bacterium]|nr:IMP dehydrogenase [bacterium]
MLTISEKYSYDDVLLEPAYSDVLPGDANIRTRLAGDIFLNIPVISAAMDTVTEEEMAVALALQGGAGVIHRNLSPEKQAQQIGSVKRYLNWVIDSPVTVEKGQTVREVREIMNRYNISGLPVVDSGLLCGIIT